MKNVPPTRFRAKAKSFGGRFGTIIELLVYVSVALALMWPATFRLTDEFVGWRDANHYMWLSWRLGELMQSWDIFSLRIPDIVHPLGVDLLLTDGLLPSLFGGVLNLFAGPVLAFNLTLLSATLLNMWAGRHLARLFSSQRLVWLIVSLSFALAPAIALRMTVHLPMYFAFTAPLLIADAVRVVRGERTINPLRLGALLLIAYLCSIYYLVFGGLAYVVIIFVGTVGSPAFKRICLRLGVALLLTLILMSPFLITRIARDRAETAAGGKPVLLEDTFRAGGDFLSIITQPAGSTIDLPGFARLRDNFRDNNVHESTVFPGFLLLIGLVGLFFRRTRLSLSLGVTAGLLWILSLGTSLKIDGNFIFTNSQGEPIPWLPFAALLKIPGLASLRAANRASYVIAAVLAAVLALSLGLLFERLRTGSQRLVAAAGCCLLLGTSLVLPVPTTDFSFTPKIEMALDAVAQRGRDSESVLLVPADCTGEGLWAVNLQILHQTPWVGCQISASAIPWYSGLDSYAESEELAGLRCAQNVIGRRATNFHGEQTFEPGDLNVLYDELDVRFLIVDKRELERVHCAIEDSVVSELKSVFEVLGEDDVWIVIDTRSPA